MKTFSVSSASKECGVSRPTLMRAIEAGKLKASFDKENFQWIIRLDDLLAAGYNPGKSTVEPPEETKNADTVKDLEHTIELLQTQLNSTQKLNTEYEKTITDLRTTINDYRRMLPAPTAPTSFHTETKENPTVSTKKWWKLWD